MHFGTNTVDLNGDGFEVMVQVGQKVKQGDLLWNADLPYIKQHADNENLLLVFTNLQPGSLLEKEFGEKTTKDSLLKIYYHA